MKLMTFKVYMQLNKLTIMLRGNWKLVVGYTFIKTRKIDESLEEWI